MLHLMNAKTLGAQNPNVFLFWMVKRVRYMVPTIGNHNKKMTVTLDHYYCCLNNTG